MKKYKGDILYSSEEDSDFENNEKDGEGTRKERKYSNQLTEFSDNSSKDELLTDKPAMSTLKKTFTAMPCHLPEAMQTLPQYQITVVSCPRVRKLGMQPVQLIGHCSTGEVEGLEGLQILAEQTQQLLLI